MDDDVEEGYGSKNLISTRWLWKQETSKETTSVGDGLSEFYVIVEYKKGKAVKQSDPLRVLDNLASRKDNDPLLLSFTMVKY